MEHIVPREKWLYNDRGMMKWMGWLLSDHSAYMESEHGKERLQPVKSEMSTLAISDSLEQAWQNSRYVVIQINALENNDYVPEITGVVLGFDAGQIFLQLTDGNTKLIHVEEIRHVELVENEKWWLDDDTF